MHPAKKGEITPKAKAHQELTLWVEGFLGTFTQGVPQTIVASWGTKADRARDYLEGTRSEMIDLEAWLRGVPGVTLAQIITAKAEVYEAVVSTCAALLSLAQTAIDDADTPEKVAEALTTAMTNSQSILRQLGLDLRQ